jgi:N-succinyldiaminopimelate aminotransferase
MNPIKVGLLVVWGGCIASFFIATDSTLAGVGRMTFWFLVVAHLAEIAIFRAKLKAAPGGLAGNFSSTCVGWTDTEARAQATARAPSMAESDRFLVARLREFGTTIFAEMSALAVEKDAINLGQGFPDSDGPAEIAEAAIAAIRAGHNQYPPGIGIPELRHAVAAHQDRCYGIELDPDHEVLITAGATEAIAAAILALCEAGDEVVTFEPYYDSYAACIAMAGAKRRVVTLRPPEYRYDPDELARAITPKTRLLLLNSPHNPTGKVFSREELQHIAELAIEHDLLVVTDEVYEHIIFEGRHLPLSTLEGMRERTVSISSAGKTFSFTGWKIGWAMAPADLLRAVRTTKQFLTYVNGAPFQHAIAHALGFDESYYRALATDLGNRRDRLCDGLAFCRRLPELCGVVAIPNVVFYDNKESGNHLVRFTFCKQDHIIDEAVERLARLGR